MVIRLEIAGLVKGSYLMALPESVTADFIFWRIFSGESPIAMLDNTLWGFDIFLVGSWSDRIFLPAGGCSSFGMGNVCPKRLLNLRAMARVSSTCWRWSSPTGTTVGL